MKNKTVKALALLMTVTTVSMMGASSIYASDTEQQQKLRLRKLKLQEKKAQMQISRQQTMWQR